MVCEAVHTPGTGGATKIVKIVTIFVISRGEPSSFSLFEFRNVSNVE